MFSQSDNGHSYNMFWCGYYNYTQLNSNWNVNTDIQHRTRDGFEIQGQTLIRTAAVYKINKLLNVSFGGAHFRYYIKNDVTRGEWRPWQEFGLNSFYGKVRVGNRLRAEQRLNQIVKVVEVTNDYRFNWRFRYKVDVEFPLIKQKERTHSVSLCNEFFINSGKGINNPFDQNRTFASFNYQLSKSLKLLFQYMYIVQYVKAQNNYEKISVIRFNIHHTISNDRTSK
ncbi:MAG: DUF2490 domain-containing protein [Bacteroidota bacterium]|nr:DUF2490 domain-containing protein [Bacteroidota bacterium]